MTILETMKYIEKRRKKSKINKILEQSQHELCSLEQLRKKQKLHCLSLIRDIVTILFWG